MTIAISLKVNDGIVLASDSATTMTDASGEGVINIYDNGNKIFNLHKGSPIGAITWGQGSFGPASIATLAKDFRANIGIDEDAYKIKDVADEFVKFMYEEHYVPAFKDWQNKPRTGFIIAGYSAGSPLAEHWLADFSGDVDPVLTEIHPGNQVGVSWNGQPEAISRLINGYAPEVPQLLAEAGITEELRDTVMQSFAVLAQPLLTPPMPIKDAIDLAEFFVDLTARWVRFKPGAPIVGGPIEIAAITKHEGFKWIKRKHYFSNNLNP